MAGDELDHGEIEARLRAIFGPRFEGFSMGDDLLAYWHVSTASYRWLNADEIDRVVAALEIDRKALEMIDSHPNAIRFVADLAPITKPDMPAPNLKGISP